MSSKSSIQSYAKLSASMAILGVGVTIISPVVTALLVLASPFLLVVSFMPGKIADPVSYWAFKAQQSASQQFIRVVMKGFRK